MSFHSPEHGGVAVPRFRSLAWLTGMVTMVLVGCGGGGGETAAAGAQPWLSFATAAGVAPVTTVVSNTVTVTALGRVETATIQADSAGWMNLPPSLVRNGERVGATTTVQDGDTLAVEAASVPAAAGSRSITVQVGGNSATWTISSRQPNIGAYAAGGLGAAVGGSGLYYAVPFTPARSFTVRYAAMMLERAATLEVQPQVVGTAIHADAGGMPGAVIARTTTESRWPTQFLASGTSRDSVFPVLGGGAYAVASLFVPEADFGAAAAQLSQGSTYWLVVQYAASIDSSTIAAIRAVDATPVGSGATPKQSQDLLAWQEWGFTREDGVNPAPGAARVMPGFFVSD